MSGKRKIGEIGVIRARDELDALILLADEATKESKRIALRGKRSDVRTGCAIRQCTHDAYYLCMRQWVCYQHGFHLGERGEIVELSDLCHFRGCRQTRSMERDGLVYCSSHQPHETIRGEERMIENVCEEKDCYLQARMGVPGTWPPVRCVAHRLRGMVYVRQKCGTRGCYRRPTCGATMWSIMTCRSHKRQGMIYWG